MLAGGTGQPQRLEVAVAHVREIAMQIHPAGVFQLIEAGNFGGVFFDFFAVDSEIARAA